MRRRPGDNRLALSAIRAEGMGLNCPKRRERDERQAQQAAEGAAPPDKNGAQLQGRSSPSFVLIASSSCQVDIAGRNGGADNRHRVP
jgi:hypothetical protein